MAVKNASTGITGNIDIGATAGEVVAHAACPITLPEHWLEWLGTIQVAEIHEANLTVAIQVSSNTPHILDQESRTIEQRLERFWHGLRLSGIPDYSGARIVLGGINDQGEVSIKEGSRLALSHRHRCSVPLNIDEPALRRAVEYGNAIQSLFTGTAADYRRLRAGYLALASGIESTWLEERLHQFVRALDGLMAIPPGPGQPVFAARGVTFVDAANIDALLRQMYVLRNTQEHLTTSAPS